jgi:hypothetical protein
MGGMSELRTGISAAQNGPEAASSSRPPISGTGCSGRECWAAEPDIARPFVAAALGPVETAVMLAWPRAWMWLGRMMV